MNGRYAIKSLIRQKERLDILTKQEVTGFIVQCSKIIEQIFSHHSVKYKKIIALKKTNQNAYYPVTDIYFDDLKELLSNYLDNCIAAVNRRLLLRCIKISLGLNIIIFLISVCWLIIECDCIDLLVALIAFVGIVSQIFFIVQSYND